MRIFWKYLIGLVSLTLLVIFYFLKTNAGQEQIRGLVEDYLSKATYNKIKVHSLNLEQYPYLVLELQVNDTANILLKGKISNDNIEMEYHLFGDSLKFNDFYIKNKVDIQGTLLGSFSSLKVRGYGDVFDGKVSYNFINLPKKIKDMNLKMTKVNSEKVLEFLEVEPFFKGYVDIDSKFKYFSRHDKYGQTKVHMNKVYLPKLGMNASFILNSIINFQGIEYRYTGDIYSDIGRLTVNNGYYHTSKKIANAEYEVHLKKLLFLEKILDQNYQGKLNIKGSFSYDEDLGGIVLKGHTEEFGGVLYYVYNKENIDFKLKEVSLESLLKHFSYPVLFSSKIDGTVNFNIKDQIVIMESNLKETRFIHSKLTDMFYDKLKVDLLAEVYDQSYFSAGYQKSQLSSTLKIDNGKNHIYLTNSTINLLTNKVNSKIEIKMQGQEIYGEIYGKINHPRVAVDKSKFMRYQTKKHLNSWLETNE